MKIYFGLNQIPELRGLSAKNKRSLYQRHVFDWMKHWQAWLFVFIDFTFIYRLLETSHQNFANIGVRALIAAIGFTIAFGSLEIVKVNCARQKMIAEIEFLRSKGLIS